MLASLSGSYCRAPNNAGARLKRPVALIGFWARHPGLHLSLMVFDIQNTRNNRFIRREGGW